MFLKHLRFDFVTLGSVPRLRSLVDYPNGTATPFYAEVQFAAVRLIADGPNRGEFPSLDYVRQFPRHTVAAYHRKTAAALGFAADNPLTLEKLAETIHGDAVAYVLTRPLVAVHAVRLACEEDFADAVTFVATTVPVEIVNGLVTYSRKKGG